MKLLSILLILSLVLFSTACNDKIPLSQHQFALAIHGGAGTILKSKMSLEQELEYKEMLQMVLLSGYEILNRGGSSLEAVQNGIKHMEDSPLFNAGRGAVFTADGKNELDASIMDGKTLNAGAIAGVSHLRNPINVARLVMEKSPHVLLIGEGAEAFAVEQGVTLVDEKYFYTKRRWRQLQKRIEEELRDESNLKVQLDDKFGTVGIIALDKNRNLAAGTSTGGMTYKKFGRVGDSPIIGAGTYANNKTCAVSCTGHGEYFMRGLVAYDISALMEYQGKSVEEAADIVINQKLTEMGGTGGLIAMDANGNIAMPFNTEGMYRGYIYENGKTVVKIYKK